MLLQQVSGTPAPGWRLAFLSVCLVGSTSLTRRRVFWFVDRRKSKARRSKSRYKMLEADEQDTLELQPPRTGERPRPGTSLHSISHHLFSSFSYPCGKSRKCSICQCLLRVRLVGWTKCACGAAGAALRLVFLTGFSSAALTQLG